MKGLNLDRRRDDITSEPIEPLVWRLHPEVCAQHARAISTGNRCRLWNQMLQTKLERLLAGTDDPWVLER